MKKLILVIVVPLLFAACSRKWNNPVQSIACPNIPTLSNPINDGWVIGNGITVAWHPTSNSISYRLQMSTSSSFSNIFTDNSEIKDTCYFVGIPDTLQTYWWRVKATNSYDTSAWSESRYFRAYMPSTSTICDFSSLSEFWEMDINGDYAFVANGYDGFSVFSLSNAPMITLASNFSLPNASSYGLHTMFIIKDGIYVFLFSVRQDVYPKLSSYLDIVNVSNPISPVCVGRCSVAGYPNAFDKIGNYVFASTDSIQAIDVSNLSNPNVVAKFGRYYHDITHYNNYLFSVEGGLLDIYDVSIPQSPIFLRAYTVAAGTRDLWVKWPYIIAGPYSNNIDVIDMSNIGLPQNISTIINSGAILEMEILENYLFCGYSGSYESDPFLRIYDFSNPKNPQSVFSIGKGHCQAMGMYDKYVLLYNSQAKQIIFYKVKR